MNLRCCAAVLFLLCASFAGAEAQAKPTAIRTLAPTVFGLMTATETGVGGRSLTAFPGSKNLGITAGLDVDIHAFGRYVVAAEARGSYPVASGTVVGERDILGGARLARESNALHAIRPYVDAHFGRGQMNYPRGYQVGNLLYQQTASNVYGGGGGVELDVTDQFSVKVDAQEHHWSTPVITGSSVWSGEVSIGVAYRIFANKGPR